MMMRGHPAIRCRWRCLVGSASGSRKSTEVATGTSPRSLRSIAPSLLHTHAVEWAKADGATERRQLVAFRPLDRDGPPLPLRAHTANDNTDAATAWRLLRGGRALVYAGTRAGSDYRNARQLLAALKRRCSVASSSGARKRTREARAGGKRARVNANVNANVDVAGVRRQWERHRERRRLQSDLLQRLLVQVSLEDGRPSRIVGVKRTPANVEDVLRYAFQNDERIDVPCDDGESPPDPRFLLSLNDFLAMVGGYEWHRKGVYVDALGGCVHPHFGVFPPTRQDFLPLLDEIESERTYPTSSVHLMEVGIGTGILSLILMKQEKVDRVIGTDVNPYAVACAQENMRRFGFEGRAEIVRADLFPEEKGKVDVVLFNPPWMPGDAPTTLDRAVYDSDQETLRRFLLQVQHRVSERGRVYLLLSNLSVLLGLSREEDLHAMFREGNLEVVDVHKITNESASKPGHAKNAQRGARRGIDEIESARAQEVVSLYHLRLNS